MKRPPTEAASLLFGVKRGLLGFHLLHQFFDPIDRKLVADRRGYALVVLDLAVEFDTLVTHFQFRIRPRNWQSILAAAYKTPNRRVCSKIPN
jgi:hypothetical protein